jgi:hypothetical protein
VNYSSHDSFARIYQANAGPGGRGEGAGAWEVLFDSTSDRIGVAASGVGGIFSQPQIQLSPNTWYFVVTVLDGAGYRLHVFDGNGQLSNSPVGNRSSGATRAGSDSGVLTLMAGDGGYTTGRMDEVRAYSYALSESEITTIYNDGDVPPSGVVSGIEVRPS